MRARQLFDGVEHLPARVLSLRADREVRREANRTARCDSMRWRPEMFTRAAVPSWPEMTTSAPINAIVATTANNASASI